MSRVLLLLNFFMQTLLLPSKIRLEAGKNSSEAQLIVEPCEAGFGTTLGNALRRVLLSSLSGAAIIDVKIAGVQHEFSTIPGVKEDVVEILLNLKQVRLKIFSDEPVRLSLQVKGERVVTAGDIEKNASAEVVHTKLPIATLTDKDATLSMELIAQRGRGYDPIESREEKASEIGLLALDALYTPVRNVGFRVDHVRVGQMTNFDRLTMTIETDGTMTATEAVQQAAQILIDHFSLLLSPKSSEEIAAAETATPKEEGAPVEESMQSALSDGSVLHDGTPKATEEEPPKDIKKKKKKD